MIKNWFPGGGLMLCSCLLLLGCAMLQTSVVGALLLPAGFGLAIYVVTRSEHALERERNRPRGDELVFTLASAGQRKHLRVVELEAACRSGARALRMHAAASPTAVMLDVYGDGRTPDQRVIDGG